MRTDRQAESNNLRLKDRQYVSSKRKNFSKQHCLPIRLGTALRLNSKCECFMFLHNYLFQVCSRTTRQKSIPLPSIHQTNYKQIKGTDSACFFQHPLIAPTELTKKTWSKFHHEITNSSITITILEFRIDVLSNTLLENLYNFILFHEDCVGGTFYVALPMCVCVCVWRGRVPCLGPGPSRGVCGRGCPVLVLAGVSLPFPLLTDTLVRTVTSPIVRIWAVMMRFFKWNYMIFLAPYCTLILHL